MLKSLAGACEWVYRKSLFLYWYTFILFFVTYWSRTQYSQKYNPKDIEKNVMNFLPEADVDGSSQRARSHILKLGLLP